MLNWREKLNKLKGKTIKSWRYEPGYSDIDIEFTDGTLLTIEAEEVFDFRVLVNNDNIEEEK